MVPFKALSIASGLTVLLTVKARADRVVAYDLLGYQKKYAQFFAEPVEASWCYDITPYNSFNLTKPDFDNWEYQMFEWDRSTDPCGKRIGEFSQPGCVTLTQATGMRKVRKNAKRHTEEEDISNNSTLPHLAGRDSGVGDTHICQNTDDPYYMIVNGNRGETMTLNTEEVADVEDNMEWAYGESANDSDGVVAATTHFVGRPREIRFAAIVDQAHGERWTFTGDFDFGRIVHDMMEWRHALGSHGLFQVDLYHGHPGIQAQHKGTLTALVVDRP